MGATSQAPEDYGADILIPGRGFLVGVQRKVFPGDFLGSLSDGRIATLVMKMAALDLPLLVLEGHGRWTFEGKLVGHEHGRGLNFTRQQLRAMLASFSLAGIAHFWTDDLPDTIELCEVLSSWAQKEHHNALYTRPNPKGATARGPKDRDWSLHLLQSFQGVGPTLAAEILDHFGQVPMEMTATDDELLRVPGLGKKTLASIRAVLPAKEYPTFEGGK